MSILDRLPPGMFNAAPAPEQISSPVEIAAQIDAYAQSLPEASQAEGDQQARATQTLLYERGVKAAVKKYGHDPEAICTILGSVSRLEDKANTSLLYDVTGYLDDEATVQSLQSLFSQGNADLLRLFGRATAVSNSRFASDIRTIEKVVEPAYGTMASWKEKGTVKEGMPDFVMQAAGSERFTGLCVTSEADRLEQFATDPIRLDKEAGISERRLLDDVLGVDPALSSDYRNAIYLRTLKQHDHTPVLPEDGGGVDLKVWRETLHNFTKNVTGIGVEQADSLYKAGIMVNFDRFTLRQIGRMDKYRKRDPALIERLRNNDTTVALYDAFGDYNNALTENSQDFETTELTRTEGDTQEPTPVKSTRDTTETEAEDTGTTLFFEVATNTPAAFYRPFVDMRRNGIKPSTCIVNAHGLPGAVAFGKSGNRAYIGVAEAGISVGGYNVLDLAETQVGRLTTKYMQPHSVTNERAMILAVCLQDAVPAEGVPTTAEKLAELAVERTAVSAAPVSIAMDRTEAGLVFKEKGTPIPANTIRHIGGTLVRGQSTTIPGV